ncbi:MAG TPA: YqgE/AlgH family protein [Tepidisphaeraceae bacterium]|nr:YqgE/AlgH family protein [Tepidisphaeraceae bacterium]
MESLKGQILLASGTLRDPNFFHSVILMVQHGKDGALGLILNRPLEITVKQACDDALEIACGVNDVLHQGGPCDGPLMALHSHRKAVQITPGTAHSEVLSGIYFSTERDELEWLLKHPKPKAKFFVGYSGWGPGQLERELETGSWLIAKASVKLVFSDGDSDQWSKLVTLATMGDGIKEDLIPEDPSVN